MNEDKRREQNSDFELEPKPERSDQMPEEAPREQVADDTDESRETKDD